VCETSLTNITAELIWTAGGILTEIDNVVEALKPRLYMTDASSTSKFTTATANSGAALTVLDRHGKALQKEIRSAVQPMSAATEAFLASYNAKLDALLGIDSTTTASASALNQEVEEVVEHLEVGVGAWASSAATVAAVVCGVLLEARRGKKQEDRASSDYKEI
jgi:hypothetical protein